MPKGWTSGRTDNKPLEDNIPEVDYALGSHQILEAHTRDVGHKVARIDYDSMDTLNVSIGDVIEIKGKRRTVVKCLPLYPSDEGKGIIRIDGLDRNNTATEIGDMIPIRKIRAVAAEKVIVAPLEGKPPIDERYLSDALESIPLIKGDNVMVPYFGGRLTFQVIGVTPAADAVLITQKTVFYIAEKEEAPAEKEEAPAEKEESVMTIRVYCEGCRGPRDMKYPKEVKLKDGRPAVVGSCYVCGTNMSLMGPMPKEATPPKDETPTTDDPLNILKIRLAKGEITIEEFNKIKEILEDDVRTDDVQKAFDWYDKGNALCQQGRMEEGLACFDEAIRLSPEFSAAWTFKAYALKRYKKYKESIVCFDEVNRLSPEFSAAWHDKGLVLKELGRDEEAEECFAKAKELDKS
jgi:hypothetical protein